MGLGRGLRVPRLRLRLPGLIAANDPLSLITATPMSPFIEPPNPLLATSS